MTTHQNHLATQLSELMTGDLLLFHNRASCLSSCMNLFSGLIDCCTGSKFSHVGIVLRDPTYINPNLKGLYLLESGLEREPDPEDHKVKLGVQITPMSEIIETSQDEDIYIRHLICNRDEQFYKNLTEAHTKVHNLSYDINIIDWITALERAESNPLWLLNSNSRKQKNNTFWCSALVAYIYVKLGFLPLSTPWTLVSPKEFGTDNSNRNRLVFTDCTITSEISLDVD